VKQKTAGLKSLKLLAAVLVAYALLVAGFETTLGFMQPQSDDTLVITTTAADGSTHERVLSRLQLDEQIYVAVNHWPRAWYRQALANPAVQVTLESGRGNYQAVPVSDSEHALLDERFPISAGGRFMMGYPPRHFLRLEPVD